MSYYLIFTIALYIFSYGFYITCSHGLGHKAEYLQLRRFIPCAILAVLPMYLVNESLLSPQYLLSFLVGVSWITAYPLFYYLTYHKISSDFGFHLDTVFGLYIIGWLISLKLLVQAFNIFPAITLSLISIMEYILLALPLFQASYYLLYGTCVNTGAVTMIFETYTNEVIEYFKSMPLAVRLGTPILNIALVAGFLYFNLTSKASITAPLLPNLAIIIAVTLFLTYYLWNTKKGVFIRTGLIELVLDVKDYLEQTKSYKTNLAKRVANLNITQTTPFCEKPATFILVIGESESRDYMSAFSDYPQDTTPWLKSKQSSENFLLYKNAYACKDQTVPALERAFTEVNQYNDKKFYESCSFVDIARKAGFKISWFSNQSHIGAADTAVTLVANTADTAEWTKLHLNQVQYDESLLGYLKQIDANENNFIVFHLKGNHFNFINRYPQDFAKFSKPDTYDLIPNYIDSIAYTDYVLQQIQEYAAKHLNLQAMVYFSDHATIPDKRRSPNFGGFATVRIPLFTYLADDYISKHPEVYSALKANRDKYWTNDLAYELICGILDIKSKHYDEANSLASTQYKYTRDILLTDLGRLHIIDDSEG